MYVILLSRFLFSNNKYCVTVTSCFAFSFPYFPEASCRNSRLSWYYHSKMAPLFPKPSSIHTSILPDSTSWLDLIWLHNRAISIQYPIILTVKANVLSTEQKELEYSSNFVMLRKPTVLFSHRKIINLNRNCISFLVFWKSCE